MSTGCAEVAGGGSGRDRALGRVSMTSGTVSFAFQLTMERETERPTPECGTSTRDAGLMIPIHRTPLQAPLPGSSERGLALVCVQTRTAASSGHLATAVRQTIPGLSDIWRRARTGELPRIPPCPINGLAANLQAFLYQVVSD